MEHWEREGTDRVGPLPGSPTTHPAAAGGRVLQVCHGNAAGIRRIMELLSLEKTLKTVCATRSPALPNPALSHVPKCHVLRHEWSLNTNMSCTAAREAEAGAGHPNAMQSPS